MHAWKVTRERERKREREKRERERERERERCESYEQHSSQKKNQNFAGRNLRVHELVRNICPSFQQ